MKKLWDKLLEVLPFVWGILFIATITVLLLGTIGVVSWFVMFLWGVL